MSTARSRARDFAPAIALAVLAVSIVAGLPWPCPLRTLTGIPCPSCGLTRAARLALHGDFAGATRVHPLWLVVLPACVVAGVAECVGFSRTGSWGTVARSIAGKRVGAACIALLVIVWVGRFLGAFGGPVR